MRPELNFNENGFFFVKNCKKKKKCDIDKVLGSIHRELRIKNSNHLYNYLPT